MACYQQAAGLHGALGNRSDQAAVLARLAETHSVTGDLDTARKLWRQALAILDELENPRPGRVRARLESLGQSS